MLAKVANADGFEKGGTNMRRARTVWLAAIFGAAIAMAGTVNAFGQAAPASPSMKTIGTPSAAAKPEIVPSLFVMNSRGASLQGDTLVLIGVTPSSIIFADRPVRSAGPRFDRAGRTFNPQSGSAASSCSSRASAATHTVGN